MATFSGVTEKFIAEEAAFICGLSFEIEKRTFYYYNILFFTYDNICQKVYSA